MSCPKPVRRVRQGGGRGLGEKTWLPPDQLKDWDWGEEAGWKLREEFMLES